MFPVGFPVEYYSASQGGWIPAIVQGFNPQTGTYTLDVHGAADPAKVRPRGAPPPHEQQPPVSPPHGPGGQPVPHGAVAPPPHPRGPNPEQQRPPQEQQRPPQEQQQQGGGGWWPFAWLGGGEQQQPEKPPERRESFKYDPVKLADVAKAPTGDRPFWKGKTLRLKDGEVNYVIAGPPWPAPLVVCVHGIAANLGSFEAIMPYLTQRGYRILAYDLFGFGLSDIPKKGLTLKTYVDQLQGLLDALVQEKHLTKNEKILLLGFSMGGRVAVEFARKHRDRVDRVLLLAPAGLLRKDDTPCGPVVFGCLRARLCCGFIPLVRLLLKCCMCKPCKRRLLRTKSLHEELTPDVREPKRFEKEHTLIMQQFTHNMARSLSSYLEAIRNMPLWDSDHAFKDLASGQNKVPVLFIWGDSDNVLPWHEVGDTLKSIFGPHGTSCIMVRGGGHGAILEDAEQISNYATAWFSEDKDPNWLQFLDQCRMHPRANVLGAADAEQKGLASA
mmetsp:Transcript_33827/g.79053  ORF Transcript_33827/g.79053 Transcript_33827/m.79053 type:complete len:499 (+) Transcript_33827:147-1643(+)